MNYTRNVYSKSLHNFEDIGLNLLHRHIRMTTSRNSKLTRSVVFICELFRVYEE